MKSRYQRPNSANNMIQTNLIIKTSCANSACISEFTRSGLRTLIATSWLQYVPLYLIQLNKLVSLTLIAISRCLATKKKRKVYIDSINLQITIRPWCNFVSKLQMLRINFPYVSPIIRYCQMIRFTFYHCLIKLAYSRWWLRIRPSLPLNSNPKFKTKLWMHCSHIIEKGK